MIPHALGPRAGSVEVDDDARVPSSAGREAFANLDHLTDRRSPSFDTPGQAFDATGATRRDKPLHIASPLVMRSPA